MKKATLIVLVLTTFFFSNCKKSASTDATNPVQDEKAILADEAVSPKTLLMLTSMRGLYSQDLKKLAYKLLTSHEKYFVWMDHIKNAGNFNTAQQALITQLTNYLTPETLNGKPTTADMAFRDKWMANAKLVFTYDQIRAIAYQIYPEKDHLVTNDANVTTNSFVGDLIKPNCSCNTGSDHDCSSTTICPLDDYHGSCQNATSWGCGFAWCYPCDNICYLPGSDPRTKLPD